MTTRAKATTDGRPVDAETGEIMPGVSEETTAVAEALAIFNEDWQGLSLAGKIARITGHVGTIPKRGYNAFHKYNFVTESDLVGAVRQYLAAAGIIIIPDVIKTKQLRPDSDNPITEVVVEYTVTDGTSSFTFKMPGHGADKGDKGVYKAITGSQKYALMKLFKIETGDDPEQDTRVDERAMQGGVRRQVNITSGSGTAVSRGGHSDLATPTQIHKVSELMKTLSWERSDLAEAINGLFEGSDGGPAPLELSGTDSDATLVLNYLKALKATQIGELISHMDRPDAPDVDGGPYS